MMIVDEHKDLTVPIAEDLESQSYSLLNLKKSSEVSCRNFVDLVLVIFNTKFPLNSLL